MFKFNRKDTRTTPLMSCCLYCIFEHISHLVLVFLLLTLRRQLPAGIYKLSCNYYARNFYIHPWDKRQQTLFWFDERKGFINICTSYNKARIITRFEKMEITFLKEGTKNMIQWFRNLKLLQQLKNFKILKDSLRSCKIQEKIYLLNFECCFYHCVFDYLFILEYSFLLRY